MKKLIFCLSFFAILCQVSAQEINNIDVENIKEVLEYFKKGYTERDTSKASAWCDKIFYGNIEIIGTYSIHPESREWFTGKDKAVSVFKHDWIAWGDLDAKIEKANINVDDNLAWVSFEATVTKTPRNSRCRSAEESASNMLKNIAELSVAKDSISSQLKLMQAAYFANLILYQYGQGDVFVWPIRISGVLQKKNDVWKFRQMHFSHPNRGFPNVRN